MEIYSTEEQQVEAIKQFWKDYGTSIMIGAVVGLGGLYGWNSYSAHKVTQQEKASEAFQTAYANQSDSAAMQASVEAFSQEHDQQGYQAMLDLMLAKKAVEAGDLAKAETILKQVADAKLGAGIGMVATIRLARVQAEQGQLDTALATLELVTDEAFLVQRDELKGDFFSRKGDVAQAKVAYQSAIDKGGAVASPDLKMKLDSLNQA